PGGPGQAPGHPEEGARGAAPPAAAAHAVPAAGGLGLSPELRLLPAHGCSRKLLRQKIHSLPQWQLEASPVLKDISPLQVRRDRVRWRHREPEDEEGFVPKKQSQLLAGHGAANRDRLAQSPCHASELLGVWLGPSRSAQLEEIENLLANDDQELTGDFSKGAVNLPLQQNVKEFLLEQPIVPLDTSKRVIIIFHCEFSVERGPKMCKFLRERDRSCHEYPQLHYPELYILKGGYRDFYFQFPSHCEPQDYRPMEHPAFKEELRKFRRQSRRGRRAFGICGRDL
ncbi:uncharacterized protein FYW23_014872, partial [Sylvia borin]